MHENQESGIFGGSVVICILDLAEMGYEMLLANMPGKICILYDKEAVGLTPLERYVGLANGLAARQNVFVGLGRSVPTLQATIFTFVLLYSRESLTT